LLLRTGKGIALAFFLFFCLSFCPAQQPGDTDLPLIRQLYPTDTSFRQFTGDVERNRRLLVGARAQPERAAENLTIYRYIVREGEDLYHLAARSTIPYSALASLNRLNSPSVIQPGMTILLPSCPGIFIPSNVETDLEKIIGAARVSAEGGIELRINTAGRTTTYLFFPGADFTPTERSFFLNAGFRFPLRNYRITSRFGVRADPFSGHQQMHQGIDLAAPEGTEVFAIADGIVTAAGFDSVLGNFIIISHNNNYSSLYGHLQRIETVLRAEVRSGTLIGRVGSTGQSTGPHLHFELRHGGRAFDPSGRLRH